MPKPISRRRNFSVRGFLQLLESLDWLQIIALLFLLAVGLTFIGSIGRQVGTPTALGFVYKQWQWIGIGAIAFAIFAFTDYRKLEILSFAFYLCCLMLLVAVPFVGVRVYGAQRWLDLHFMRLQPSELMKLAMVMALSALFANRLFSLNSIKSVTLAVLTVGVPFVMIFKQPDLGSAIILLPVAAVIVFAANLKLKYIAYGLLAAIIFAGGITANELWGKPLLKEYHRERISVFVNPESDLLGKGYNTFQSKLAVGSGGIAGKGLGGGTQSALGFLPQTISNNDFIFSVIAEETGFIGVLALLAAYIALIYSMLRTAFLAANSFGKYIALGFATVIFTHAFINMSMSVGLMPVTGLPLPFVSYGGSFVLMGMAGCGLLQSIYRHRNAD